MRQKLLLAMDGSDSAYEMVRYIGATPALHRMDAVLYNVFSSVPDSYWDLEKDPQFGSYVAEIQAWEMEQKRQIGEFMKRASDGLARSGFPESNIMVRIQDRKIGVARDIVCESEEQYHAVMVGRKGIGKLKGIVLGSVASKLLERITHMPLIMVGEQSSSKKLMIALDGSDNAMRAVEFVGQTLGGFDHEVILIHVIRGGAGSLSDFAGIFIPKEDLADAENRMTPIFEKAEDILVQAGFAPDKVMIRLITGVRSRAAAIVQAAEAEGCGTIVMGRRGLSKVQEFFMGRVGNKIVQMTQSHTLWVIT